MEPLEGTWGNWDDPDEMKPTKELQTASESEMNKLQVNHDDISLHNKVWEQGYPNRWGAKIPLKNRWNLEAMDQLLQEYEDREVVEWLRYGWPTGRLPSLPQPSWTFKNHKGALDHPQALQKYIQKELNKEAVMGPFKTIPFRDKVGISPIST